MLYYGVAVATKYISQTTLNCEAPMRTPSTIVQIRGAMMSRVGVLAYFRRTGPGRLTFTRCGGGQHDCYCEDGFR